MGPGAGLVVRVRPVIVLWAHSRSASTAFLRMMIERGDVAVLHEPFLALAQDEAVMVPTPGGGSAPARSARELVDRLAELGRVRAVFVKEVLDYRYDYVFGHPGELAWMTHTFLVRDPRQAISSHYAVKPTVTCPEIGYEWLHELFELISAATGGRPLVIRAEDLLRDHGRRRQSLLRGGRAAVPAGRPDLDAGRPARVAPAPALAPRRHPQLRVRRGREHLPRHRRQPPSAHVLLRPPLPVLPAYRPART